MSERPSQIPILTDMPVETPQMGFEKYVSAIAAATRGGEPAQYTIGLYGPWGKGKSSILKGIEAELASEDGVTVVPFDAWRYEKAPDLVVPLVWRMRQVISEKNSAFKAVATALKSIEVEFYGVTLRRGERQAGLTEDRFLSALEALSKLGDTLGSDQRVVVLVDDLDRCSPGRVMEVIESIRILMDVPGFVFVLAIDYDVLKSAIRQRYENVDADQFIEKIVQVPFRIPELNNIEEGLVSTIVRDWTALRRVWFPGLEDDDMDAIARLALRSNPRQIKRVINSGMLARFITWEASSPSEIRLLLASLAMQQRWPDEFSGMVSNIERWLMESEGQRKTTLAEVVDEQLWLDNEDDESEDEVDHDLPRFMARFLAEGSDVNKVIGTLRLAFETSGIAPPSDLPEASRRRKSVHVIIERELIPEEAILTLDLRKRVRPEVVSAITDWMAEDSSRADVTWVNDPSKPLRWGAQPNATYSPSGLVNEIFRLAGRSKPALAATDAWRYNGRTLASIATSIDPAG